MTDICKKQPCNDCPYRKDAPLRLWAVEEFEKLLEKEDDQMGTIYYCHKKDGKACTGWLMMQSKSNFPSIALRLKLIKLKVPYTFFDSLNSPSPLYKNIIQMCRANYPGKFKNYVKQKNYHSRG